MRTDVLHHRGRVASLTRSRTEDDPELQAARRDLAAASIAAFVERHLAKAPPLTEQQRADLARMFAAGGGHA